MVKWEKKLPEGTLVHLQIYFQAEFLSWLEFHVGSGESDLLWLPSSLLLSGLQLH